MKKSIYIIGIAAMGLMASCSSDSDYRAVAESTINVLSAQTMLDLTTAKVLSPLTVPQ